MQDCRNEQILIIDFGSQYTQLIARRVRELGVYCEILPYDCDPALIEAFKPKGVILSGGPESVHVGSDSPRIPDNVFTLSCPVLGICYGMQALAYHFGGKVHPATMAEFGHVHTRVDVKNHLLGLENEQLDVWMSHGDHVSELPEGFVCLASSNNTPVVAMAHFEQNIFGLQFHPEVTHTPEGMAILKRFVVDICGAACEWTPSNIVEKSIADIKAQVGNNKVLLGLSGGVDSAVVAMLCHRAIGTQLTCVFVDNGLLRQNEAQEVVETFGEQFGLNLIAIDASHIFLEALEGVSCPEEKRKIIGKTFIDVFDAQAKQIDGVAYLAQGTIYPDVIESAGAQSGKAHVIKSHHNVGGLPEKMALSLCEPLKMLFKDEVRKVGLELGLPEKIVYRHPFPGPGLAVRVLGEVKPEYLNLVRQADAIFIEALRSWGWYDKVSQAFTVFLPVKAVGVMGDQRRYEYVISLRSVETLDFMTAKWSQLPFELLAEVSNRIMNEVRGVARVTYDISGKPPATIEWE